MQHMRRCSGQLYMMLEVPPNATDDVIKKAYHQKAMQYHPDKAGDAFRERFQELQDAEEILRDPARRRLYDIFGRQGMRTIEGGIGAEYADLLVSNLHRIRWLVLLIAYFFLMCAVEMIVLVMEVDNDLGWSWEHIFIPIWIIDVLLGAAALGLLYEMVKSPRKIPMFFLMFVTFSAAVIATIFICLALDNAMPLDVAFIPVLVLLGSYSLSELLSCDFRKFKDQLRMSGDPNADAVTPSSQQFLAYVINVIWRVVTISLFVLLLYLKVTGQTSITYYLVFLPLFLWLWLPLVWRLFLICCTNRVVRNVTDRGILTFMLLFTYTNSFLTVGLLAVKCHQADVGANQLSLLYVMIPPLVVCVILTMVFCAIALILPNSMMQLGATDYVSGYAEAASEPMMQAHRAAQTTNQFAYAAEAAKRGNIAGATAAAADGVRMTRENYGATAVAGYGATEMETRT
jgi:hypothetical protein